MAAARELADAVGPFTRDDLADRLQGISRASPGDRRLVRETVINMQQTGDLVKAGQRKVPDSRRPMNLYLPGDGTPRAVLKAADNRGEALARMMALWG